MCRRVSNKTIILLGLAGYKMIITNSALRALLVIYHSYPVCPRRIIIQYIHIYVVEGKKNNLQVILTSLFHGSPLIRDLMRISFTIAYTQ